MPPRATARTRRPRRRTTTAARPRAALAAPPQAPLGPRGPRARTRADGDARRTRRRRGCSPRCSPTSTAPSRSMASPIGAGRAPTTVASPSSLSVLRLNGPHRGHRPLEPGRRWWPRARARPGAWPPSSCSSPAAATRSRPAPATARARCARGCWAGDPRAHDRSVGAVFVQDRWQADGRLTATRRRPLLVHRLPQRRQPPRSQLAARVQRDEQTRVCAAWPAAARSPPAATS